MRTRGKNYSSIVAFTNTKIKNYNYEIIDQMKSQMIQMLELQQKREYETMLTHQDIMISLFQVGLSTIPLFLAKITNIRYNGSIKNIQNKIDISFYQDATSFYASLTKPLQLVSLELTKKFIQIAKLTNVTVFEIIGILFILTTVLITILQLAIRRKRITITSLNNKR